jgi:hypothetical protein
VGLYPGFWGWDEPLDWDYEDSGMGQSGYPGYSSQPNVTVVYLPPAPGSQYSGRQYEPETASPIIHEYSSEGAPAPSAASTQIYFSFALRNGPTRYALAYWVQDQKVHYIDMDGERGELALSNVNRARSEELNHKRGIDFWLPAAQ